MYIDVKVLLHKLTTIFHSLPQLSIKYTYSHMLYLHVKHTSGNYYIHYIHVRVDFTCVSGYFPQAHYMATNRARRITLDFNCGYARAAVRELTPKVRGNHTFNTFDIVKRALEFQELFASCPNYGFPENYFDDNTRNGSLFNCDCDKILKIWSNKWTLTSSRQDYEEVFSINKWKELPSKENHTLARCKGCRAMHYTAQLTFPKGPHFSEAVLSINTANLRERQGTVKVLSEVNAAKHLTQPLRTLSYSTVSKVLKKTNEPTKKKEEERNLPSMP